jgi:hypothetical protein
MSGYIPNPRDPLVQRLRRSVLETLDPHATAEGPREPQLVQLPRDPPGLFERALDVFNARPWRTLAVLTAAVAAYHWIAS